MELVVRERRGANDVSYFPFDEIAEALVLALSTWDGNAAFPRCSGLFKAS